MAKTCSVCGKGTTFGRTISHSHKVNPRTVHANLQKVRVLEDGSPATRYVCTKCLKANKVVRA